MIILLILIALALLNYFWGFNIVDYLNTPKVASAVEYVKGVVILVWQKFLYKPAGFIWNSILVGFVWKYALIAIEAIKNLSNN